MSRITGVACICLLLSVACCFRPLEKASWKMTYRKVDTFLGSILIQIGTDSCYYESTAGIYKDPTIIQWKSGQGQLNNFYKQVEKFNLQNCSPIMASVTEEPFETIELVKNGRVLFAVQKEQQNNYDVKKFDSAVVIMRSFATAGQGWQK